MVHLFAMIRRRFMRAGRDPDAPAPIPLSISDLSPWSDEPQGDGISHLPSHTSPVEVTGRQSWGRIPGADQRHVTNRRVGPGLGTVHLAPAAVTQVVLQPNRLVTRVLALQSVRLTPSPHARTP